MKPTTIFSIIIFALFNSAIAAPKAATDVQNSKDTDQVDVIVQFVNQPTSQALAALGVHKGSFANGKHALLRMSAAAAKALATDANVSYVSLDREIKGALEFANPGVYADLAFSSGWNGAGVGVAVVDSGIISFADFNNNGCGSTRIVYKANFVAGETTTNDTYGHGTHVAGIIGGNSKCATPMFRYFRGIAPAVNLISLRALNAQGTGTDSSAIAAIDAAVALKNTYNIRVLNLSLGRGISESYTTDPLCQAVERAWKAGIVVVVSAGNLGRYSATSGYGTISSPGNDPYVITVGAMNDKGSASRADDIMASYSSKGPSLIDHVVKPDLVAPGNSIMSVQAQGSTLPNQLPSNIPLRSYYSNSSSTPSTYYMTLNGTSMAAPMVAGAAALLIQKTPSLTPNQVKARLMKTAGKNLPYSMTATDTVTNTTYTMYRDAFTVGAGYLDVNAALASNDLNLAPSTTALSPRVTFSTLTKRAYQILATSVLWGDSLLWGDSVLWGDNVVWGDTTIFGNSLLWGDTTVSGNSILWGDSLLASQSLLWGDTASANTIRAKGDR